MWDAPPKKNGDFLMVFCFFLLKLAFLDGNFFTPLDTRISLIAKWLASGGLSMVMWTLQNCTWAFSFEGVSLLDFCWTNPTERKTFSQDGPGIGPKSMIGPKVGVCKWVGQEGVCKCIFFKAAWDGCFGNFSGALDCADTGYCLPFFVSLGPTWRIQNYIA